MKQNDDSRITTEQVKITELMDTLTSSTRVVTEHPLNTFYKKVFDHFNIVTPSIKRLMKPRIFVSKTAYRLLTTYVKKYFKTSGMNSIMSEELALSLMRDKGPKVHSPLTEDYVQVDLFATNAVTPVINPTPVKKKAPVKKKVVKKKITKKVSR